MKKEIGQIAKIRSGYQFRGRVQESDNGNVQVIQIKDVDQDGRLNAQNLARVNVDNPERYFVDQGDVLFLSRGRQLAATEIAEPVGGVIATSYYFILTPKREVMLPGYLVWALNHSTFQRWLSEVTQTTSIPWISRADFEQLKIDVPTIEAQQKIIDIVSVANQQKQLTQKLISVRDQLIDAICMQLMSGQLN